MKKHSILGRDNRSQVVIINTGAGRTQEEVLDARPRWFSWPFENVFDKVLYTAHPFSTVVRSLRLLGRSDLHLLVFNPSISAILACTLFPSRVLNIICLYQWVWNGAPMHKRIAIYWLLLRASKVLVYDRYSEELLSGLPLVRSKIVRYPIFTDQEFFEGRRLGGGSSVDGSRPLVISIGDHLRDDRLLVDVAKLQPKVLFVRVSRNPLPSGLTVPENLEFRKGISAGELRALYRSAAAALVLTREIRFPVGITALAEAIAGCVPVIATEGAGGGFFEARANVFFVPLGASAEDVADLLVRCVGAPRQTPDENNLRWLSGEQCIEVLADLIDK